MGPNDGEKLVIADSDGYVLKNVPSAKIGKPIPFDAKKIPDWALKEVKFKVTCRRIGCMVKLDRQTNGLMCQFI